MKYTKLFDTIEALDAFVEFQAKENDLHFYWDRVAKRAWIDVDEDTYCELEAADMEEGIK